jgi:hypothetical protein
MRNMAMTLLNETEEFTIPLCDNSFEGSFCVADSLRETAKEICEKQGITLPTRKILFLYDKTPYLDGPAGSAMLLPKMTKELFYQVTGCMFDAALIVKLQAVQRLREAQFSNEIYHCLRHFAVDEATGALKIVRRHEVEQWKEQAAYSNGAGGFSEDAPNLFDERIYPIGAEEKKEGINEDGNTDTVHDAQDQRTEAA